MGTRAPFVSVHGKRLGLLPFGLQVDGIPMFPGGGGLPFPGLGKYIFVDSNNGESGSSGLSPSEAVDTIDEAVGLCAANQGDVIVCLPGHAEAISAAAGIDLDVAGVTVLGLGHGADRATITLDTATTTDIDLAAASVGFINCLFKMNFADIAAPFHLTAADCFLLGCEFRETAVNMNWDSLVVADGTTDNAVDGFKFNYNKVIGADVGNENLINGAADITGLEVIGNYVELGVLDNDAMIQMASGKDLRSIRVLHNEFYRLNTAGELLINVGTTTANTGICAHNLFGCLDVDGVVLIEAATRIMQFENYVTGVADESGYLDPAAGADA